MSAYATAAEIKLYAAQAGKNDADHYEQFAEPASRIIDGLCRVSDDYFQATPNALTEQTFQGSGTHLLRVSPYRRETIQHVEYINLDDYTPDYVEITDRNGVQWLKAIDGGCWRSCGVISIQAVWGFAEIPSDIREATCELTLLMKYQRDPAQTKILVDVNGQLLDERSIPKRVREICDKWKRRQPLVFA